MERLLQIPHSHDAERSTLATSSRTALQRWRTSLAVTQMTPQRHKCPTPGIAMTCSEKIAQISEIEGQLPYRPPCRAKDAAEGFDLRGRAVREKC